MKYKANYSTVGNIRKTILLMIPMILLIFLFISRGDPSTFKGTNLISFLITFLFFCYLFFMILYTGKTDRYRAAGFVSFALFFTLVFIVQLIQLRGERTFTNETMLSCQIPFCHIVTTMIIIPICVYKKHHLSRKYTDRLCINIFNACDSVGSESCDRTGFLQLGMLLWRLGRWHVKAIEKTINKKSKSYFQMVTFCGINICSSKLCNSTGTNLLQLDLSF